MKTKIVCTDNEINEETDERFDRVKRSEVK